MELYPEEVQAILAKYPPEHKRSAVMPLLYLAQRERGYVTMEHMEDIAAMLEISPAEVASIVGFYTLYHDKPEGKIRLQVCTDVACALRGADEFLRQVCDALGIQPGETTPDGLITIEEVMCIGACDRAPVFQTQQGDELKYYENMTVEATLELIEALRREHQDDQA